MPDCRSPLSDHPCPKMFAGGLSGEALKMALEDCEACWFNSEEYLEKATYSPLFNFCIDWISREGIGLETPKAELSFKEEQAIMFVKRHNEDGASRRMKRHKPDQSRDRD